MDKYWFLNKNSLTEAHIGTAYEAAYQSDVLNRYSSINSNHQFSTEKFAALSSRITSELEQMPESRDVAVIAFGSFARRDASAQSDLDYLLISKKEELGSIQEAISKVIKEEGIDEPNPEGVFNGRAQSESIIENVGGHQDGYKEMSQRLLFLLESKPLFGAEKHEAVIDSLIDFYGEDVARDPRKNYVLLLNDVIRYFRTICVNYAYTKKTESSKWPIRNIKLRHSRVLMYASLISMLGVLSVYRESDINDKLREFVKLTPLQRLHRAYLEAGDTGFYKVAGYYDVFLSFMNDKVSRAALNQLKYENRYSVREFAILKANSDALSAEITRFLLARRRDWSERFYEYLFI